MVCVVSLQNEAQKERHPVEVMVQVSEEEEEGLSGVEEVVVGDVEGSEEIGDEVLQEAEVSEGLEAEEHLVEEEVRSELRIQLFTLIPVNTFSLFCLCITVQLYCNYLRPEKNLRDSIFILFLHL